jgi:hypothetical protein
MRVVEVSGAASEFGFVFHQQAAVDKFCEFPCCLCV